MNPQQLLEDLTEPQRRAVTHIDGPWVVLAGAGSGKTRVITRRAAYLACTATEPQHVLALTFTNKAADEMRQRIEALGLHGMTVCTFHSLCARLLREFAEPAGLQPNFSIFDEQDRAEIVRRAIADCDLSIANWPVRFVQSTISWAKNYMHTPEAYAEKADDFRAAAVARIWRRYDELMREQNALDFDDLLLRTARLLSEDQTLRDCLEDRYRYVLIDEYQDTNLAQFEIAYRLCKKRRNLCATGDPDQSIYGWRGANIGNILEFEEHFPEAKVVLLEQNYRSTKRILAAASALIAANRRRKRKTLWTENPEGAAVRVIECKDSQSEAEQVISLIRRMHEQGRPLNDFAVFYRINALTRVLETALRQANLPYQVARGVEFYARKEIKDVVAYLRVLVNPADEVSMLRIINTPARGIGKTTIGRLQAHARRTGQTLAQVLLDLDRVPSLGRGAARVKEFAALLNELRGLADKPVKKLIEQVLERSGLQAELEATRTPENDRLANVNELISAAAEYDQQHPDGSLAEWLAQISLVSDTDSLKDQTGCVTLMTLHAAKGLEFPVVFLVGLEEGLLPHVRAKDDPAEMEEERRLCFVGMTRAKEVLVMTRALRRQVRGTWIPTVRSPFLYELPTEQIEWDQEESPPADDVGKPWQRASSPDDQADHSQPMRRRGSAVSIEAPRPSDLKPGQLVTHPRYGTGRVVWVQGVGEQAKACVQFNSAGRRTFYLRFATLQPVR